MGAQTKGNTADPLQRQTVNTQREQEQRAYLASQAVNMQREQEQKAQEQYAIDQRSQYEKLIPQDLRNKVSFEDAYADRGPAAAREKNNTGPTRRDLSSSKSFDLYRVNRREQRERRADNTPTPGSGIAFGPGRSSRGDVDLRRLLQDRMTKGN